MSCCNFENSLPLRVVFVFLCIWVNVGVGTVAASSSILTDTWPALADSICTNVSSLSSSIELSDNIVLSSSLLPTVTGDSDGYSNEVTVTLLSSSLVGEYGDSYAIAVLGVNNSESVQWQFVHDTGMVDSASNLTFQGQSRNEIQYDNRYGLFHFYADFNASFPSKVVLLSPTDKIRFKFSKERSTASLNFADCKSRSIQFVFFNLGKLNNDIWTTYSRLGSRPLSIEKCPVWPFSNLVFRLCPGLNASTADPISISSPLLSTTTPAVRTVVEAWPTKSAAGEFTRFIQTLSSSGKTVGDVDRPLASFSPSAPSSSQGTSSVKTTTIVDSDTFQKTSSVESTSLSTDAAAASTSTLSPVFVVQSTSALESTPASTAGQVLASSSASVSTQNTLLRSTISAESVAVFDPDPTTTVESDLAASSTSTAEATDSSPSSVQTDVVSTATDITSTSMSAAPETTTTVFSQSSLTSDGPLSSSSLTPSVTPEFPPPSAFRTLSSSSSSLSSSLQTDSEMSSDVVVTDAMSSTPLESTPTLLLQSSPSSSSMSTLTSTAENMSISPRSTSTLETTSSGRFSPAMTAVSRKSFSANCTKQPSALCGFCTYENSRQRCPITVYPLIFDLSQSEFDITITLNLSRSFKDLGDVVCSMTDDAEKTFPMDVSVEGKKIELEVEQVFAQPTSMYLSCRLDEASDGQSFLSKLPILVASMEDLVQHKTPFVTDFDTSLVDHKSVLVTFIDALPSQLAKDLDSGAACVVGDRDGPRYPASWETPSITSCSLDATIALGLNSIYVVRRRELEDATFLHQAPVNITVVGGGGGVSTTPSTANVKSAQLMTDLKGISVDLGSAAASSTGNQVFDCDSVFLGADSFGSAAVCELVDGVVSIFFGTGPTIVPKDPLLIKSGVLLQGGAGSQSQYDVIMMTVPADTVAPVFDIVPPGEVLSCQEAVTLAVGLVSNDGGRGLTYNWTVSSGGSPALTTLLKSASKSSVEVPVQDIGSGAVILATGCNFVSKCTESTAVSLTLSDKQSTFSVAIVGIPDTPLPALKIALEADPALNSCNHSVDLSLSNITYTWAINGTTVTHDSVYTIKSREYTANSQATVTLSSRYWNPETRGYMEASTAAEIRFGSEPLVAVVDGTDRTISVSHDVSLDASLSYDPNTASSKLGHLWACSSPCDALCASLQLDWTLSVLVVPKNTLKVNCTYLFTDAISNGVGGTVAVTVRVAVVAAQIPLIQLIPPTSAKVSVNDFLKVQAYVQSSVGSLDTKWLLYSVVDGSTTPVDVAALPNVEHSLDQISSESMYAISLSIPPGNGSRIANWRGLSPGKYTLRLTATNADGTASTDYAFQVSPPLTAPVLKASPLDGLSALQTVMEMTADMAVQETQNNPLLLTFGLRSILVDNQTEDTWFKQSAAQKYRTLLAAAWPEPHAACNERIGYEGLLQVCDLSGACTETQTNRFVVQHPLNQTQALNEVLLDAVADIASGDIDNALQIIRVVQQEQCNASIDQKIADALIEKVLDNAQGITDPNELVTCVGICTAVMSSASDSRVMQVVDLIIRTQNAIRGAPAAAAVSKRSTSSAASLAAMANIMTSASPEANADVLLNAFDVTVKGNYDLVEPYLNNVLELISSFCTYVDSTRTMTATGKEYTSIQAESLTPGDDSFLNSSFGMARNNNNAISFDKNFKQYYSSFHCGQDKLLFCSDLCLGSADISKQILADNQMVKKYFFPSDFNTATSSNLVSDFYYILLKDTQSGATLTLPSGVFFTIHVPINSYIVSNYYNCFVYSKGYWESNVCQSNQYATKTASTSYSLGCKCSCAGIVAVFQVTPPVPPYYPPMNEVLLTFNLSTTEECSGGQMSQFLSSLSAATTVTTVRFQNIVCANGSDVASDPATIVLHLRPPFKDGQSDNSHAVQSIKRAVSITGGLTAYSKVVVTGVTAAVVERPLQGDGNARKIPFVINKSFRDVIGNNSDAIAQKWMKTLATTVGVDPYRIKNAVIAEGMVFNFTITLPFDNEKKTSNQSMSAEELSLLVMEQSRYREIDLRDVNDQSLIVDPLNETQIVQLVVHSPTDSLMTILAVVVSSIVLLASFVVGGLVVLKIRTDKMIEQHNRNIRTVDIDPSGPLTVIPFESNGTVFGGDILDMDKAADTVVLGRRPVRTRHR